MALYKNTIRKIQATSHGNFLATNYIHDRSLIPENNKTDSA